MQYANPPGTATSGADNILHRKDIQYMKLVVDFANSKGCHNRVKILSVDKEIKRE